MRDHGGSVMPAARGRSAPGRRHAVSGGRLLEGSDARAVRFHQIGRAPDLDDLGRQRADVARVVRDDVREGFDEREDGVAGREGIPTADACLARISSRGAMLPRSIVRRRPSSVAKRRAA